MPRHKRCQQSHFASAPITRYNLRNRSKQDKAKIVKKKSNRAKIVKKTSNNRQQHKSHHNKSKRTRQVKKRNLQSSHRQQTNVDTSSSNEASTLFIRKFGRFGKDEGEFTHPTGITKDNNDDYVIADIGNFRVQVIDKYGCCKKIISCERGRKFWFLPEDVAVSDDNHYFIADKWNHEIIVTDDDGKVIRCFGERDLVSPTGIAINPINSNVYVVDTYNNNIQVYNKHDGRNIKTIGCRGDGEGQLHDPLQIAIDEEGKLFVADCGNHRIQVFDSLLNDKYIYSIGRNGDGDGDGLIYRPLMVALGNDTDLYVTDVKDEEKLNFRLLKFDSKSGRFIRRIDCDDDKLLWPRGIAFTNSKPRTLIVSDWGHHCFKEYLI